MYKIEFTDRKGQKVVSGEFQKLRDLEIWINSLRDAVIDPETDEREKRIAQLSKICADYFTQIGKLSLELAARNQAYAELDAADGARRQALSDLHALIPGAPDLGVERGNETFEPMLDFISSRLEQLIESYEDSGVAALLDTACACKPESIRSILGKG